MNHNVADIASVRNGKWQLKFETNANRMKEAYYRCGSGKAEGRRRRRQAELYEPTMTDLEFARSIERNCIKLIHLGKSALQLDNPLPT